ncbi:hypothetical protein BJ875DRAFT_509171 [Amylocarpus encephaloides]|uniref:Protein kinase domain-containing protein n=1 Tax=Amylocarpus encephaloides TaxID=45428 RepID=A0A9P7YIV5_9HELO|nr:hypothetical protein BJ875DRAFT_509171 [Amylocarpus encephaloides]
MATVAREFRVQPPSQVSVETLAELKKEPTSREASHLEVPLDPKTGSEVEYSRSLEPIPESSTQEDIKCRLRNQPEKTQTKKEVRRPKDVVARKIQGLDDDNGKPKGANKSVLKIGDNSVVSATAKDVKKRKADGDTPKQAPEKEEKRIKKNDEKTAVKNDNLSKRRTLSDGRPESVNHHTAPQKSYSVADESTDRIPRDLEVLEINPIFTEKDDEVAFSHTKVIMRRGPFFFYSTIRARYKKGTQIDLTKLEIHPTPRTHIYPVLPTLAPTLPPDVFLKRPSLVYYADSKCLTEISALFMHEAQMYEMIKRSPHPNVVKYFGCPIDEDGRISELCFARYGKTLDQMIKDGEIFDRKACLDDIRAGIDHLHSLGMIHCDINPHNVFADVKDFVIEDFDSCTLEGDDLGTKAGTDGWTSDDFVLEQRENDWFGFAKMEQFLFPPKEDQEMHMSEQGTDSNHFPTNWINPSSNQYHRPSIIPGTDTGPCRFTLSIYDVVGGGGTGGEAGGEGST